MIAIESMHKQGNIRSYCELSANFVRFALIIHDVAGKESLQIISHIETIQAEISSSLAQNRMMIKDVKDILDSNVALIKNNVESLKSRVDRLMSIKK